MASTIERRAVTGGGVRRLAARQASLAFVVVLATVRIAAATVYVANNGTDNGNCGATATPCRSITWAITKAALIDMIVVRPGLYGDLDRNGTVGDSPGEEAPSGGDMIVVYKQLKITSRDGAGSTVIDPNGDPAISNVVLIDHAKVKFGVPNHGFTIRGGVNGILGAVGPAKIQGNRMVANQVGIAVENATHHVVNRNVASDCTLGGISDRAIMSKLTKNLVVGNPVGIEFDGTNAATAGNVAVGNGVGVDVINPPSAMLPSVIKFKKTVMVGNSDLGLKLRMFGAYTGNLALFSSANDYFGNGERAGNPFPNCGVRFQVSDSSIPAHSYGMSSTGDFWGPSGPGPDPADDALGVCDTVGPGTRTLSPLTPAATEVLTAVQAIR